ncbi:MAG: glycosyltransferase family 39 protein [Chthonomonadales bacterium]|nr:glycosyltransferase family 39 protein [Chthonomonadales bacterium]
MSVAPTLADRSSAPPARRETAAALLLLGAAFVVHLWLAATMPLAPDETYYWEWSRRPALGYYDQGPMIAWWIRASTALLGATPLGVRLGVVVAALATQALAYLLGRDLFGPRAGLLGLVFLTVTPLSQVGATIATYDPLQVLFWVAATWLAARAAIGGRRWAWIGMGVAVGLGTLSKHTMVLFAPCLLLFLALPAQRTWLRRPEPYLAVLAALAVFAPNLWWQAQHGWMTFEHLVVLTAKGADQSALRRFGDFVGSQAALVSPPLFFGFLAALRHAARVRRDPGGDRWWLLFCLSLPVLLFFTAMTLKAKAQANWAAAAWVTPAVAYGAWLAAPGRRVSRAARAWTWAAGLFALGLSVLLAVPGTRLLLPVRFPARWDQGNKLYGGPEVAAAADREAAAMRAEGSRHVVPGAATYDIASRLAFYMRGQPRTRCLFLNTRLNSYVAWNDEAGLRPGDDAILVDGKGPDDPELPAFAADFDRVVPVPKPVEVWRRGLYDSPVRVYFLYRCYGYRQNPAAEHPAEGK